MGCKRCVDEIDWEEINEELKRERRWLNGKSRKKGDKK
jgi:hypothetical protein